MVARKTAKPKLDEVKTAKVTRVHAFENGAIAFDAIFDNAVSVYGMTYREGTKDGYDYSFISFPSRKGNDGKYYGYVYFKISDALKEDIEKQISSLL